MSELLEENYPLEKIVEKFREKKNGDITTINDLLALEEDERLLFFEDEEECFFGINNSYSTLSDVVSDWFNLTPKDLDGYGTMLDYAMRANNIVTLDDGRVIFITPE